MPTNAELEIAWAGHKPATFGEEGALGLAFIEAFERAVSQSTIYSLEPKRNRRADDPIYEDERTNAAYWAYCAGRLAR